MRLNNFDKFLNEGLISDVKQSYPAAVEYFEHDLGDSWVKNNCSGNTPEEMMAHLLVQHFISTDPGKYNIIIGNKTSSAKDMHLELSEQMDSYNEMDPPIFSKEEWKSLDDAIGKEIENAMH